MTSNPQQTGSLLRPILINLLSPLPKNLCSFIGSVLSLLPLSIPLHPETIDDTIRARVPLSRLAHLLCSLDDAAIVAAVELNDTAGGIDSTPASVLDRFNEPLTHVTPELYRVSYGDYIKQRYSRDANIVPNVE